MTGQEDVTVRRRRISDDHSTSASLSFCHRGKSKRQRKRSAAEKDCSSLHINTFFKYILLPSGVSSPNTESRVLPHPRAQLCYSGSLATTEYRVLTHPEGKTHSTNRSRQKSLSCSLTQKIHNIRVLTRINRSLGCFLTPTQERRARTRGIVRAHRDDHRASGAPSPGKQKIIFE